MGEGSEAHATQNSSPLLGKEVGFLFAHVYEILAVDLWEGAYLPGEDHSCPPRVLLWRRLPPHIIYSCFSQPDGVRALAGKRDLGPAPIASTTGAESGCRRNLAVSREKKSDLLSFPWKWAFAQTHQDWTEPATMFIHQKNMFVLAFFCGHSQRTMSCSASHFL